MKDQKRNTQKRGNKISRRIFIGGSAAAVAFLTIVPRNVLVGPANTQPGEKLDVAGSGVGEQGKWAVTNGKYSHKDFI